MPFTTWMKTILLPWFERELYGPFVFFGAIGSALKSEDKKRSEDDGGFFAWLFAVVFVFALACAVFTVPIAVMAGALDLLARPWPQPWTRIDLAWLVAGALLALLIAWFLVERTREYARS